MRRKVAFVSLWDASNRNTESGYAFSMRQQLRRHFDVVDLFPLNLPGETLFTPLRAFYRLAGQYYHPMREPMLLRALARHIERQLSSLQPDFVFSPSSVPGTFIDTKLPWVFASDQVFRDFVSTYVHQPAARFVRLGNAQEARALATATIATYPSAFAAQHACCHYGAASDKVVVIPWGANLPRDVSDSEVAAAIAARRFNECRLLFLGRDWKRKGGDQLVLTVSELNRRGLRTSATIIGCAPAGLPRSEFTTYPYLNNGRSDHFQIFCQAMATSHFLFLPSRAEAYGQALCEAAAFGVPAVATAVGGIPTIIRHGDTGFVVPLETSIDEYCDLIAGTMAQPENYCRMAEAARAEYCRRLNWNRFGDHLAQLVNKIL